jgi:hypothetical protein
MPYRINPQNAKEIQVKKGKRWRRVKLHKTAARAKAHLAALRINVKEKKR